MKKLIPIGYFIGVGFFIESLILLYRKYILSHTVNDKSTIKQNTSYISDEVAQAMASKIKFEAKQHRRNREN